MQSAIRRLWHCNSYEENETSLTDSSPHRDGNTAADKVRTGGWRRKREVKEKQGDEEEEEEGFASGTKELIVQDWVVDCEMTSMTVKGLVCRFQLSGRTRSGVELERNQDWLERVMLDETRALKMTLTPIYKTTGACWDWLGWARARPAARSSVPLNRICQVETGGNRNRRSGYILTVACTHSIKMAINTQPFWPRTIHIDKKKPSDDMWIDPFHFNDIYS